MVILGVFNQNWLKLTSSMKSNDVKIKPVLRVHKDRHDSKSGQIVSHTLVCYNVKYYMDPETAKFSRLKWSKFVSRLISMWGVRKCNHFNPKLPTFIIANS